VIGAVFFRARAAAGADSYGDERSPRPPAPTSTEGARRRYGVAMCRNIRTLHNFEPPASEEEVRSAALQYVRKVSGMQKPSQANTEAFELAVEEVAKTTARLIESLVTSAPPRDREVEAERRRARAAERFGRAA